MNWKLTLLVGSLIILAGCVHQPTKPTKPTLVINAQPDGGFCVDKENAAKLGTYILQLESQ